MKLGKVFGDSKFVFEEVSINADFGVVGLATLLFEYLCEKWVIAQVL